MIFAFFLFPLIGLTHIIQDDVSITEKSRHSFKYVCSKSGYPDSPLIDYVSGTKLDCMGRKIEVGEFCEKEKASDPYYLRASVDKSKQEIICVSGKKVLFKYLCVKLSDSAMCSSESKKACLYIKDKLAKRLDLIHSSFVTNEKGIKQLNCFFESNSLSD
jgi:hypothetical protein